MPPKKAKSSILTPKIKYFYLFLALLVGLSRVVVGAHYLTDVIGGIMVAIIGLKLTLFSLQIIVNFYLLQAYEKHASNEALLYFFL